MYIDEIVIENYGCIENLIIKPEFDNLGHPKPMVVVGKNGSGKTLLLSGIVDSIIEFKRSKYSVLQEVNKEKYYRLGSKLYIKDGENYSYTKIRYKNKDKFYSYVDFMVKQLEDFRNNEYDKTKHTDLEIDDPDLKEDGFQRKAYGSIKDEFKDNIFMYFPVHRYYEPAWLNQEINISIERKESFIGISNKNIVKTNILHEVSSWILDVILDERLYELNVRSLPNLYFKKTHPDGSDFYEQTNQEVFLGYNGKNSTLRNHLNKILTIIYTSNDPLIKYARIGVINKEAGRRVSIILMKNDDPETTVAPTFNHLSSGEALLLCIFASLLKEYDSLGNRAGSLDDVSGIVVIDEVDLNLHIDFAKNVVPKLMKLFPNIQFILTTHSPFFLLGMRETYGDDYQLINLPNGENINENDFPEIVKAYNIFTKGFNDLKANLYTLEQKIKEGTKPLIITEGKTDWKHLKAALEHFENNDEYTDLDIVFLEYEDEIDMGDSHLNSLLKNLSKIKQDRMIIGIFDCDENNGKEYAKEQFRDFGNNVYAFSIPLPTHRANHSGISTELLYKDEDLMQMTNDNRRLYLTSEFNERGRLISDYSISVQNLVKIKRHLELNNSKIIDSEVTDGNNNIALSKNDFAVLVLNKTEPFNKMSFEGFRGVFDRLMAIINAN